MNRDLANSVDALNFVGFVNLYRCFLQSASIRSSGFVESEWDYLSKQQHSWNRPLQHIYQQRQYNLRNCHKPQSGTGVFLDERCVCD